MKIVLDTNVLIAAFITRGFCSELFDHCIRRHELITSEFILDEFQQHLLRKFNYTTAETDEALALLRSKMSVVIPVVLEQPTCRDPDDDVIIGTAVAADVACIVTGDKDLLILRRFDAIEIVNPAGFSTYEAGLPPE